MNEPVPLQERRIQTFERMARAWYFKRDSNQPDTLTLRARVKERGEELLRATIEERLGRVVLSAGTEPLHVVSFELQKRFGFELLKPKLLPATDTLNLVDRREDEDDTTGPYYGDLRLNTLVTFGLLAQGLAKGHRKLALTHDAEGDTRLINQ